jgi:hypothetical protein
VSQRPPSATQAVVAWVGSLPGPVAVAYEAGRPGSGWPGGGAAGAGRRGPAPPPQAPVLRSQPGLGVVLAARVLGEFGDAPARSATAKGRKAFAGTAPVTRSSGLRRVVVARAACNQRLVDAWDRWALVALSASPGARRC